jgi:hypothetical protein
MNAAPGVAVMLNALERVAVSTVEESTPLDLVGVRYRLGGVTPQAGFDCYSLLCYVRAHWFDRPTPFAGIPARRVSRG